MGSVANDKHAEALRLFKRWRFQGVEGREKTLQEFAKFCAEEISAGLWAGGGILVWNTQEDTERVIRYVALTGVRKALETTVSTHPPDLPRHVQVCVEAVVKETRAARETKLKELTSQQVYDLVQKLSRLGAASILHRLSFGQRQDFIAFIQRQVVDTYRLSLACEDEPEDYALWLLWYVGRLHAMDPTVRQLLDKEVPTVLTLDLNGELGPQPRNKKGEPINLAGPVLVKVFGVLTGLPTNDIPAPASSDTKLGLSFGVSRDVIKRWRTHPEWGDLKADITLDGKGGVRFSVDEENLQRSARIAIGHKRGP